MSDSNSTLSNIPEANFGYNPNEAAAITIGVLYLVLFLALSLRLYLSRSWWGLCLPIGVAAFSSGFFLRQASVVNADNLGIFVASQFFIIVSPATFLAFNYIIYGRMMRTFAGDRPQYSLIRPRFVSTIFVISDFFTFVLQGAAAGLSSNDDPSATNLARILLKIGLILQLVSYIFFVIIVIHSHRCLLNDKSYGVGNFPWILIYLLYFSSVFIVIRGAYRIAEQENSTDDHLSFLLSHEVFFYLLDTLPLFLATVIYVPFWPGNILKRDNGNLNSTVSLTPLSQNQEP
ncbi:RTA1 like protein [Pyrrhoderma noxium]|uniref:RTA1 like protein n=1 Tax=Pyrrhoderma noxium TaxID=2282107 RepID=A0A286UUL9_9AGAM|nr:RTA1 like protein [Pyrrhoderma noxium]